MSKVYQCSTYIKPHYKQSFVCKILCKETQIINSDLKSNQRSNPCTNETKHKLSASPKTIDDPTSEQTNIFHRQKKATVEHQKVKTTTVAMANRAPRRFYQLLHPGRKMTTPVTMLVQKARVLDKGEICCFLDQIVR